MSSPSSFSSRIKLITVLSSMISLSACASIPTKTPFVPPTAPALLIEPTFIITPTQITIRPTPLPTIPLPTATINPANCISNLTYVSDLTIPDGSSIPYGTTIDKQWLVQNSGTCNWNFEYTLRHIGGGALGAPEVMALYPAKSGTQATIKITFTAPFTDGDYESAWQAFDTSGLAFGDPIYMRITVVAP